MHFKAIAKQKWLVMNSRDFKKAIMKLSTKKGNDIREYHLNVEELLQEYVEYEHRFEIRKREEEAEERGVRYVGNALSTERNKRR